MTTPNESDQTISKAQSVRDYLAQHPRSKNATVAAELEKLGVTTDAGYVAKVRTASKKKGKKKSLRSKGREETVAKSKPPKYPRHALRKVLRLPLAILRTQVGNAQRRRPPDS